MKIQNVKWRCDNCSKEVEVEDNCSLPINWYTIEITLWQGSNGRGLFNKEFCSKACALSALGGIKEIPDANESGVF